MTSSLISINLNKLTPYYIEQFKRHIFKIIRLITKVINKYSAVYAQNIHAGYTSEYPKPLPR